MDALNQSFLKSELYVIKNSTGVWSNKPEQEIHLQQSINCC